MSDSIIYLDNAATSWPKPEAVYRAMDDFLRTKAANPGRASHRMAVEAAGVVQRARVRLSQLFNGGDPSRVVFACNATHALNLGLKGLLRPGDHVVTTSMEHNSVRRPLRALEDSGVAVTRVLCSGTGLVDPREIERAITARTRMLVVGHASNVTGAIQPVREIGGIARSRDLLFLVDAAQSAGVLPIDVEADFIDLLAFPGHKGLYGPPGTGGLFVGRRVSLADLLPLQEGGTGGNSEEDVQPMEFPSRYEAGTLNTVGIAGLDAGISFLMETGIERVAEHERTLATVLIDGLRSMPGVTVYTPEEEARRLAVVSFRMEGWDPADIGVVLDQSFGIACRTGVHCAPDAIRTIGAWPEGTVRLSPGYFNTREEIEGCLRAIAQVASSSL